MSTYFKAGALAGAIALGLSGLASAATVPAGVQLAAKQEMVRNNRSSTPFW